MEDSDLVATRFFNQQLHGNLMFAQICIRIPLREGGKGGRISKIQDYPTYILKKIDRTMFYTAAECPHVNLG